MSNLKQKLKRFYQAVPVLRELNLLIEHQVGLHHVLHHGLRHELSEQNQKLTVLAAQFEASLLAEARYQNPRNLSRFAFQSFSQNGEDGMIAEIFRRIGVNTRYFVEVGAGDGLENNTAFLLAQGWKGCWIEGDGPLVQTIEQHFREPIAQNRLRVQQSFVTAENIAALLESMQAPSEFDLLSLDIDRNTYFAWEALKNFQPRVAVIEYNSSFPPDVEWTVTYEAERVWNNTMYQGASLKSLELLGRQLGYALVGCDLHGVNAFFVRRDLCGEHFAEPFTAENHFEPPRHWLIRRDGHPRCFDDRFTL